MIIFFIFLGLLPSFAWLIFFLREDIHPEPKKMIARAFIAGALITLVAIAFQILFQKVFQFFYIGQYSFISFLTFGAVEEILKFLAAYLVVRKSQYFDEPIDAMIYIIVVALGFATIENIAVMSNITILSEAIGIITFRFVGATLLHALSSGFVGYYWARSLAKIEGKLSIVNSRLLVFGIILASLLHGIFNYLIIIFKETAIYPTIFLIIVGLLVFWDFEKIKSTKQTLNNTLNRH